MRLPAEWEPQRAVLFSFPRRDGDWGKQLDAASRAMVAAANAINAVTPTTIIVGDKDHFDIYKEGYEGSFVELPTNDCWVRDYGPITCEHNTVLISKDFTFNGWGGKFEARLDNGIPAKLSAYEAYRVPYQKIGLELEGGAIESDGAGTILTTTACLLNHNRNDGGIGKAEMEEQLRTHLGAERMLWLTHGYLEGDDTDSHVDTLARFLDAATIAYVGCDDESDVHYLALKKMEAELRAFRTPAGEPYRLVKLPWCPTVLSDDDGHRLPATYANFLISNGHLFLPTYYDGMQADHPGVAADAAAVALLEQSCAYKIVRVPSRAFIEQHGSLHCLTMQLPSPGDHE